MPFTRSRVEGDCNLVEHGSIDCGSPPLTEARWSLRRHTSDPPWGREATITIGPAFAPVSLEAPALEQPNLLIELTIPIAQGFADRQAIIHLHRRRPEHLGKQTSLDKLNQPKHCPNYTHGWKPTQTLKAPENFTPAS